jgi:proline iminopeptidase
MKLLIQITLLCFSCIFSSQTLLADEVSHKLVNGVEHLIRIQGKGEPIVVLHGGPGMFHDYLLPYLSPLAEKYQVIYYDQRGNGGSQTALSQENFTIDQLVEDLEGIRVSLNIEKLTLLGHSWGGLLAMHYGIKYPQHLKRLILANSAPSSSPQMELAIQNKSSRYTPEQMQVAGEIIESGRIQNGDTQAFKSLLYLIESVNMYQPERISEILGGINYTPSMVSNALMIDELKNANHFLTDYDVSAQLVRINVPVLIVHGDADFIPLSASEQTANALPHSQLVVLAKSGHYTYAEQPDEFFAAVNKFMK